MGEEGYIELRMVVGTMAFLGKKVASEGMMLDGPRHVLFGPRTEPTAAVCKNPVVSRVKSPDDPKARAMAAKVPRTTPAPTG
jgi:hypothetical protein